MDVKRKTQASIIIMVRAHFHVIFAYDMLR